MRFLFRLILILAIVAAVTYWLGYWSLDQVTGSLSRGAAAGPASTGTVRDRADRLGAQAGRAAEKVGDFVADAELTAKIKAKMALDDSVRARAIGVSTTDGVVTLAGTVGSAAERDRAVRLAQETKGIKRVVNHLTIVRP